MLLPTCPLVDTAIFLTRVRPIKWNLDDVQHGGHRWREYGSIGSLRLGLEWIGRISVRVLFLGYAAIDSRAGNPVRVLLCFVIERERERVLGYVW